MRILRSLPRSPLSVSAALSAALTAVLAAACSGGGGTEEARISVASDVAEEEQVVVEYDHDQDDDLDVLTLDPSRSPMTIVEAFEGDGAGNLVDATASRRGAAIDAAISEALAEHLATALTAGGETELVIADSQGRELAVRVLE